LSRLLAKQLALLLVVRDEWIEVGLATEPADWPQAEHGVRLAYEAADLPAAALVVWLRSP